jgi:hypothetical protein
MRRIVEANRVLVHLCAKVCLCSLFIACVYVAGIVENQFHCHMV